MQDINWQEVKKAISKIDNHCEALDILGYSVVTLEEFEGFQKLTQHTLSQIVLDLQEYLRALNQAVEKHTTETPES